MQRPLPLFVLGVRGVGEEFQLEEEFTQIDARTTGIEGENLELGTWNLVGGIIFKPQQIRYNSVSTLVGTTVTETELNESNRS